MRRSRGFTLLLSVLVISMILSVALGITSIVIKENQLATLVRESEAAFHAADKGIDCALYYHLAFDRQPLPNGTYTTIAYSPFPTSSASQPPNMSTSPSNEMDLVTCGEDSGASAVTNTPLVSIWSQTSMTAQTARTTFTLNFGPDDQSPCAVVEVYNYINAGGAPASTITSEGYNICDPDSPRRTLRVIEVETVI